MDALTEAVRMIDFFKSKNEQLQERVNLQVKANDMLLLGLKKRDEIIAEATELIQYFVDRVENGTIRSRTTYRKYKEFLDKINKLKSEL